MTGKEKCKLLRRIRRDIASANHLDYHERDCTHTGPCAGTCPYCEAQLRQLEGKLNERRSLGKRIALAGLSMGLIASNLVACDNPLERVTDGLMVEPLQGDVTAAEQTETAVSKGELIAQTAEGENTFNEQGVILPETEPQIAGGMPPETVPLMGDMVIETGEVTAPETEVMGTMPVPETTAAPETFPGPTMGVMPMPETEAPETEAPETETTALMGDILLPPETAIAGGILLAPELPEPETP